MYHANRVKNLREAPSIDWWSYGFIKEGVTRSAMSVNSNSRTWDLQAEENLTSFATFNQLGLSQLHDNGNEPGH